MLVGFSRISTYILELIVLISDVADCLHIVPERNNYAYDL